MKGLTYIAGAAVTAMVAMTAVPNDAVAVPAVGSFGLVPSGDVILNTASGNIDIDVTQKTYPGALVNIVQAGGNLGVAVGDIPTLSASAFEVPTGLGQAINPFTIDVAGFTYSFTTADLHALIATTAIDAGALNVDYQGTITAAPVGIDTGQAVFLSQSCDQSELGGTINCSNTLGVAQNPIPEPASMALLGSALLGFGLLRRRRRNA